jgi:putative DNA primase/helicase
VHAHALDAFGISPVLEINSPELECGKSVNQSVMRRLTPRALTTTSISMSGIFRTVEKYRPTLFVDEGDAFLALNEDLRGILNSSHFKNDAFVIRTEGDQHEPRAFSTWCAKSIALIGNLPPTLRSRAIVIQMKRKTAKDKVEDFHGQYPYPELETLKRQAWRWTRDNLKLIRNAEPPMPAGLINRTKDNWSPLFVIAQVAGGEWPNKCLDAVLAFQESRPDETSVGVMLLTDLQELFRESEGKPLPTEEILKSLATMDERPWPEWKKGKPITARQLAKLLKPFGVTSKNVRFGDKIPKGYELCDCQEAFARYIASNPLHPLQDNKNNDLGPLSDPLQTGNVADQKSDLSNGKQSNVADVADRDPWDGND